MHIALDVTPLESGHKNRGTGIYTDLLIKALKRHKNRILYSFFTRGQSVPKNVDIVHYPYFEPFSFSLPIRTSPKPMVVTVHDLIPITYSDHFPRGIRGELTWQVQKRSLQKARAVITDSISSKHDIKKHVGFESERIHVIPLAPSEIFRPRTDAKQLADVKEKFGLPDAFVLYVGDVNWNKNVIGLLRAFHIVKNSIKGIKLVLVGKQFNNDGLSETREINSLVKELNLSAALVRPGFIEEARLPFVYSMARVYVQASYAEGFGLPILEAMACGCPVVCTGSTSTGEIAGPSILVRPDDIQNIAEGIKGVLQLQESNREQLIQDGLRWVNQFSWRRVAADTIKVYESITI